MTTPLTDERVVQLAKEHNLSSSSRGIRAHWDLMNFVKAVQQPSVAPPAPGGDVPKPLRVWYGSMPESNGRTNWTAILHRGDKTDGHIIDRSQYPHRVRYEADRVRYLLGELDKRPQILDYDGDERTPCHLCGGLGIKDGKPCWGLNFEGTVHNAPTAAAQGQDAAPAEQPQAVELLDERGEIRRDLKSSAYCVGNEYKPFHPSASHVRPEWRDGWNACFVAAIAQERKA